MKKFLLSTLYMLPLVSVSAFASPISLSLFQGELSLLDKLLLCGIGIALIGAIFLCIAFFKPTKKDLAVDSPFDAYLEEDQPADSLLFDDDSAPEEDPEDASLEAATEDAPAEESLPGTEENALADSPDEVPAPDEEAPTPDEESPAPDEETPSEPEVQAETPAPEEPQEEIIYPKLILTHLQTNDFVILPLYPETSVGRKPENDLVLSDVTISGIHCKILNEEGVVSVLDENSTNGTFINGERITEKTELHHGDKLLLGKQEFSVSIRE